jgi:hypothetical protein
MSRVTVVNVKGIRGADRNGVVYVGRPFAGWPGHRLANPYRLRKAPDPKLSPQSSPKDVAAALATITEDRARAECLSAYRAWLMARPTLDADLEFLWMETVAGLAPLGCWCCDWDGVTQPAPGCHAVILAEMLNQRFGAVL